MDSQGLGHSTPIRSNDNNPRIKASATISLTVTENDIFRLLNENKENIPSSLSPDLVEAIDKLTDSDSTSIYDTAHDTSEESSDFTRDTDLSPSKEVNLQSARSLFQPDELIVHENKQDEIPALPQRYLHRAAINVSNLEDLEIVSVEAPTTSSGAVRRRRPALIEKLALRLMEIFPDACSGYIRNICEGKTWSEFDDIVSILLNENYPKRRHKEQSPPRKVSIEEQLEIVKDLFPDADPTFLRCKVEDFGSDHEALSEYIFELKETEAYPTMKEYLRKQKLMAQSKQYTTEFNVENFLKLFPEPEKTFMDPKRTIKVDTYSIIYISNFFNNKFDMIPVREIRSVLFEQSYRVVPSYNKLMKFQAKRILKHRRKHTELVDVPQNIAVLQELAYIIHREEIEAYNENKKKQELRDRRYAKKNKMMNTCRCCFDEEVMPKDTFRCPRECAFCKECVLKSCEVAMGEGKTEFKCLDGCDVEFTLQTLQNVLPPNMFSKLAQKKTVAEVQAAGIAELESCPFCDFATIPKEADKIFHCLNEDCMKESCRFCKQENHIPYKCDEVERDADVEARTYVENKMTEALLRKCWKCGLSFFKEEGCNKMTCSCGAQMCYICKSPVNDYSHFNGLGGDKHHLCPLYSDSNAINRQNVMGAAQAAKAEIDPALLKVDPTVDIEQHYEERKRILPREPHLDLLDNLGHGLREILIQRFLPPRNIQPPAREDRRDPENVMNQDANPRRLPPAQNIQPQPQEDRRGPVNDIRINQGAIPRRLQPARNIQPPTQEDRDDLENVIRKNQGANPERLPPVRALEATVRARGENEQLNKVENKKENFENRRKTQERRKMQAANEGGNIREKIREHLRELNHEFNKIEEGFREVGTNPRFLAEINGLCRHQKMLPNKEKSYENLPQVRKVVGRKIENSLNGREKAEEQKRKLEYKKLLLKQREKNWK